ncbi:hypothetical protein [Rhizorhabdus dicambivorans]|uniref:Uncharacterized protein n=1 Tax=Rhizorhabdus dicambivorans TaxID=1850238 RepID=A0A2A4FYK3_9SPHN|nr:hypothetical protein [Rhizorhabdus dicambivorans]ATE63692.1 hypothetical protein CMV14_04145 [Rhizorhabdus dicambivorans]PCE42821.1 hypothetical protein COO09_08280 [Rhizorhabdus dicambivorans]
MGRKVVFLGVLAAGLVQMAPALAQTSDQQPDQDKAPVAAVPEPAEPPLEKPRPAQVAVAPEPEAEAEARPPVMDRARELAEKDLAAAPPEEQRPVLVDPGDARRALARARRAAAEAQDRAEPLSRPAVAAAEPAPPPVAREAEDRAVYAENRDEPPVRDDRDDGRPVYADRGQDDAAAYPEEEEAEDQPAPVARDVRARQARQIYAEETVEPAPRDLRGRQARQVLAEDEAPVTPRRQAAAPVARDLPVPAPRPVYADDDRDAAPAYPDDRRAPADDVYGRVPRNGDRYAIVDRSLRPDARPMGDDAGQQWGGRAASPICDDGRADQLLRAIRRKADFERIDGRAAADIEDEIGHAADLQRSYCESGMNDWREQRLDRLYAQIEDRIRYEEDRRWRR